MDSTSLLVGIDHELRLVPERDDRAVRVVLQTIPGGQVGTFEEASQGEVHLERRGHDPMVIIVVSRRR